MKAILTNKNWKRLFSIILSIALCFSFSIEAFASTPNVHWSRTETWTYHFLGFTSLCRVQYTENSSGSTMYIERVGIFVTEVTGQLPLNQYYFAATDSSGQVNEVHSGNMASIEPGESKFFEAAFDSSKAFTKTAITQAIVRCSDVGGGWVTYWYTNGNITDRLV